MGDLPNPSLDYAGTSTHTIGDVVPILVVCGVNGKLSSRHMRPFSRPHKHPLHAGNIFTKIQLGFKVSNPGAERSKGGFSPTATGSAIRNSIYQCIVDSCNISVDRDFRAL